MTRTEARIAVRLLGVLVVGLSIRPMMTGVTSLPWALEMAVRSVIQSDPSPPWHWTLGFFFSALFFMLCVLLGVHLCRHAENFAPLLFPETRP